LLGMEGYAVELSLEWFENNFSSIFIPLYVGTVFYMLSLSPLVYTIVNWLWIRSVRKERLKRVKEQVKR